MNNANQTTKKNYSDLSIEEIRAKFANNASGELVTSQDLPRKYRKCMSPNFISNIRYIRKDWCGVKEDNYYILYNGWVTGREVELLSLEGVRVEPATLDAIGCMCVVIKHSKSSDLMPIKLILTDLGDESVGIFPRSLTVEAPFQFLDGKPQDEHDDGIAKDFKEAMIDIYKEYFDGKCVASYEWELDWI